jgi:hypothetical protein
VVGCQPYAPAVFTPRCPWYSFLEAKSTPGTWTCRMPRKKSPPGIDPGTFRLVAQCLNHYATPGPKVPRNGLKSPESGRGIALHSLDLGARRGWVVSTTPLPLYPPGKNPVPFVQEAGWAPGPVWTCGKSRRPARSQSPYRLSYPGQLC